MLLLCACHSTRNAPVVAPAPPGQAQVVFLRPTKSLQEVSVYLLDAGPDQPQYLGRVPSQTKVAARVPSGDHLFMVVGDQTAEFMQARLAAGSTYYALLRGRFDPGADWHFFLLPIHRDGPDQYKLSSSYFHKWEHACVLMQKSADDEQWYAENHSNVRYLAAFYLKGWTQRSAEQKAERTLNAEDGVLIPGPPFSGGGPRSEAIEQAPEDDGR